MTLDRYLARRFLQMLAAVALGVLGFLALIDLVENVRRFGDGAGGGLTSLLGLTFLHVPRLFYDVLPLVAGLAAIGFLTGLARASELVVLRAAGRSGLRSLVGPALAAFLAGALAVAGLNPVVAATARLYDDRVGALSGRPSVLAGSGGSLWLRQPEADGATIIRAGRAALDGTWLTGVTFLTVDAAERPVRRIEARSARLVDGAWRIEDATDWPLDALNPEAEAIRHAAIDLPSTLTVDRIREGFAEPASISVWALPAFIDRLEATGFSARRHRVFLQSELALPATVAAMVLVVAGFTMRHPRGARLGAAALVALLAAFGVHALRLLALTLGESGAVSPGMAAWVPPLAVLALALTVLLHQEES